MSELDQNHGMEELIAAYLSGEADRDQVHKLEQWVQKSSANREIFIKTKTAWQSGRTVVTPSLEEVEQAWQEVLGKTRKTEVKRLVPRDRNRWWAIAASIVLLLALGYWMIVPRTSDQMQVIALENAEEAQLPDGSTIHLRKGGSLTYTLDRKNQRRIASLEDGAAYFDVTRDEKLPFIVQTSSLSVEVLGTAFYIDVSSEQDTALVIVQSGSVAVSFAEESVTLVAGQKAILDLKTEQLIKAVNEDMNYLSWKENRLTFSGSPLHEVVATLAKHFGTSVIIEGEAIRDCQLSATFTDKTLAEVITIIESSLQVRSEQVDDFIVLKGDSCQ